MGKSFWLGSFALLIVLQAPLLLALDCNGVSQPNYNTCMGILNTNLTDAEKSLLISNLDYSSKFYPDHSFIYQRNTLISTPNPPSGTYVYNGQYVRNAWVSLLAVMPSMIYNNALYVPNKTTALTAYSYQVLVPSNYYSSGYPSTSSGDCKRIYTLAQNTQENKVYVNGNYQGSGKLVSSNINQDSEIKSVYSVFVGVNIDHYSWNRYCCRRSNGRCTKYCNDCNFNYQQQTQDNPSLSDSLNVKYSKSNLFADVKSINSYDSTKFGLNYSNSIELAFQNSKFSFYQYVYSINYSKYPYQFYTLKADDYKQESSTNIFRDGSDFIIKNTNNCTIKAFDWFYTIQKSCILDNSSTTISISTDKLSYLEGDDIIVSILPSNIIVSLSYNNQTINALGSYTFKANVSDNQITAIYKASRADRVIFVSDGSKFALALKLILLFLFIYLMYRLLQKYWRRL